MHSSFAEIIHPWHDFYVLVGTASDLRPYAMTQPDQKATVTIGDRTLVTTLKAGMLNLLDYAKGTP